MDNEKNDQLINEMSKEVLLITGACGVGKTTTAKAWAKSKQGAIIECDYLTEWIFNDDFPQWNEEEEKFTSHLSALMAKEYLKRGMSVAIENVWSPIGIEILRNELANVDDLKVKSIWLRCERSENHRRDQQRIPEDQMKERVDIVNEELSSYNWPDHVHVINTTNLPLEGVLEKIEKLNS